MRENRIRSIWKAGGAVVNGWLAIPSAFSAETMAHQGWDSLTSLGMPLQTGSAVAFARIGGSPAHPTADGVASIYRRPDTIQRRVGRHGRPLRRTAGSSRNRVASPSPAIASSVSGSVDGLQAGSRPARRHRSTSGRSCASAISAGLIDPYTPPQATLAGLVAGRSARHRFASAHPRLDGVIDSSGGTIRGVAFNDHARRRARRERRALARRRRSAARLLATRARGQPHADERARAIEQPAHRPVRFQRFLQRLRHDRRHRHLERRVRIVAVRNGGKRQPQSQRSGDRRLSARDRSTRRSRTRATRCSPHVASAGRPTAPIFPAV